MLNRPRKTNRRSTKAQTATQMRSFNRMRGYGQIAHIIGTIHSIQRDVPLIPRERNVLSTVLAAITPVHILWAASRDEAMSTRPKGA